MRIAVVIPNAEWASSAGVRIRYRRIAPHLTVLGHRLDLFAIADLAGQSEFDADVYLFCKCQDIRSVLLARAMTAAPTRPLVGIDLFDDYFSQTDNSRFTHMRDWLARIVPHLDFGLCATPAMQDVVAGLAPVRAAGLPLQVMNDPFGRLDLSELRQLLPATAGQARAARVIRIGWFGTGDNPDFPVGLQDLSAMSGMLTGFAQAGYGAELSILTNRRAMTGDRLSMLARLPVPWTIDVWSEAAETALVARSLVCFLPVNAQGFSTVKSLNRAVTALTGGAQVLSAGYPLYRPLDDFVYRDPAALIADLEADTLRLRPRTLPSLADRLQTIGDPGQEAARLCGFLQERRAAVRPAAGSGPGPVSDPVAVILGLRVADDLAEGLRAMGHLVVANPFVPGKRAFDLRLTFQPDGAVATELSALAAARLPAALIERCVPAQTTGGMADAPSGGTALLHLEAGDWPRPARLGPAGPASAPPVLSRLQLQSDYDRVMAQMAAVLGLLYPGMAVQVAEQSAPFRWQGATRLDAVGT